VIHHDDTIQAIAFSSDGAFVLTGGFDRVAKISEREGGHVIARLPHEDRLLSATFAHGGRVITGTFDGEVTVWNWRPESLIARGCASVTRDLTPAEWHQRLPDEPYHATCR
jgi:WD40 repeat protein